MEGQIAESFIGLGEYGIIGVMLSLVALSAVTVYLLAKFAGKHVSKTNEIIQKHSEAQIESQSKNTEALTELKNYIKFANNGRK